MTLDPKTLEAAGIQLHMAVGRIEQIFAQREMPPPEEWAAMYAKEVQPILEAAFDAADLVERSELERRDRLGTIELKGRSARLDGEPAGNNPHPKLSDEAEMWGAGWQGQNREITLIAERDEARLARDELSAAQHREYLQVKELGKQLTALREALQSLLTGCDALDPEQAVLPQQQQKARAVLTDTTKAAAQRVRVDENTVGEVLKRLHEAGWAVASHNDYRHDGKLHAFWLFTRNGRAIKGEGDSDLAALNVVEAMSAAALQAGEGPEGGG